MPNPPSPSSPATRAVPSKTPSPVGSSPAGSSRAIRILGKVIDQTDRRVFKGESVPASEKIVSFFEDHTDIIVKKRRDTEYGHKVFLSGGASTMILGCLIVRGNPADTDQYQSLLGQHKAWYGRMPRQVSADGGFASKENLAFAKRPHQGRGLCEEAGSLRL